MNKLLLHIILFATFTISGLTAKGQTFIPDASDGNYPGVGDQSEINSPPYDIVCTSCASPGEVYETFRVTPVSDGTSTTENAFFEWVVYGGRITSNNGSTVITDDGEYPAVSNNRHYIKVQGYTGTESSITVQMDVHLPAIVWVAVRQSGEYGCTDGKWSVHLMRPDDVNPVIDFVDFNSWIDSLVVVTSDASIGVDLASFTDSIHYDNSFTVVDVNPSATDNCTTVDLALEIDGSPAPGNTFAQSYDTGEHDLTSTATDCQGNDLVYNQKLFVYDADDFSLASPPDSTFANNDCNPDAAALEEEMGRITVTAPAGWSVSATNSTLNSDAAQVSGCQWSRTRDYTVTLIHANNHNTRNIYNSRTYFYTVDNTGPTLVTKNISVNLDASGNATIQPVDIVTRLYDDCADSLSITVVSFTPSTFSCLNLNGNTITLEVADVCGNHTTETATVSIFDQVLPAITCQANVSSGSDAGVCGASLTLANPVATDNCSVDSVFWVMTGSRNDASPKTAKQQFVGTYVFPVGVTTVTYTVKDQSENLATCSFTVTVTDNVLPTMPVPPANIAHLAWQQRNYTFNVPAVSDNCAIATYTMSVNGGAPVNLFGLDGTPVSVILNGEAPGDVNGNGVGVNNTIVFSYSDGVNPVQTHSWNIHVDYRPRVVITATVNPTCIGDLNGYIQLPVIATGHQIETRKTVLVDYSFDNITYTSTTAQLIPNLPAGHYYFRVSTLVGLDDFRSYSDTLDVELLDPPLILLTDPATAVTNETCQGDNLGAINIAITYLDGDGIPNPFRNYTMAWTKDGIPYSPLTPLSQTGLDSSVYHVRVTDTQGCWVEQTYIVAIDNNTPPTMTDAAGITVPDPMSVVDGVANLNVTPNSCFYLVTDNSLNPSAADGTCPATLTHDFTGMPGYSWGNTASLNGAHLPVGRTVIAWTAIDASTYTITRTYAITVIDNEIPLVTAISDIQYPYCDSIRKLLFPAVSENCTVDSVKCNLTGNTNWWPNIEALETETYSTYDFDLAQPFTTVTWTVWDHYGSSSSDSYNVTFTIPIDTTSNFSIDNVQCHDSIDGRINLYFAGGNPNYYITVGSVFTEPNGALTHYEIGNLQPSPYTITIRDADLCQKEFNVTISEPNIITAPFTSVNNNCFENSNGVLDLTVQGGSGGFSYAWTGPTYNYADAHPWSAPPTPVLPGTEDQADLPTGRYSLTVTDARLCTANFTYDILSNDVAVPAYTLPAIVTTNSDLNKCTYTVAGTIFDPIVTPDACQNLKWHNIRPAADTTSLAGLVFNQGTTAVTWRVYDRSGNGSTFVVNYQVTDVQSPQFTTPPATVNGYSTNALCGYRLNLAAAGDTAMRVSDNCPWPAGYLTYRRSDNSTFNLTQPFSVKFPIPDTIIWTLRDAAGNITVSRQLVYVRDTIKPVINCSNPLTVYLRSVPGNSNYILREADYESTITDNCVQLDTIYANRADPPFNRTFRCSDVGQSRSVNISAIDVAGNTATCNRQVIVRDTVRPVVGATARTIYLNPTSVTLNPASLNSTSLDNCDPTGASLQYRLVFNGVERPDSIFTCSRIGINPVTLRVYDRIPGGNYRDVSVNVTVADTIAPTATLFGPPRIIYLNSSGEFTIVPANLVQAITDNCDNISNLVLSANPSIVRCDSLTSKLGRYSSVMLTMNDRWGNNRTVRVSVDVLDTVRPIAVLKNITIRLGNSGSKTISASAFNNGSSDNCGPLSFTASKTTFTCSDVGTPQNVNVTVSDGTNSVTKSAVVTVIPPVSVTDVKFSRCGSSDYFTPVIDTALNIAGLQWRWLTLDMSNWGMPNRKPYKDSPSSARSDSSHVSQPLFAGSNVVTYKFGVIVQLPGGSCPSDTFEFWVYTGNGSNPDSYTTYNVDECLGSTVTYSVPNISGATGYVWTPPAVAYGHIESTSNASAIVHWTGTSPNYTTAYVQMDVVYSATCFDRYRWYAKIDNMTVPTFTGTIAPAVCPLDIVTYRLSRKFTTHTWKAMTAASVVAGGSPTDSSITLLWNGALGAQDFVKVIVHNSTGCVDSASTSLITISDSDKPYFTSTASDFNRPTMRNQTNRCDTILDVTRCPIPVATDICNFVTNPNITLSYSIVNNSVLTDTIWKGDPTNFNSRRLDVGVWKVTWVVTDAAKNKNVTPFSYTLTVTDYQAPSFTTTPADFYYDSELTSCTYTHNSNSMDLAGTDNCMPIDSIWCQVGASTTHLPSLNGVKFTSSVTPVTWYVRDNAGRQTTHSYNVHITDVNDPEFAFDTFPADAGSVNYEGSFASNTRFYVFEDAATDSFNISVPAVITDFCGMGPVTVTLTDPDLTTVRGPFTVTPSGSNYVFTNKVALGRTVIDWTYSDAAGNILQMSHRVIFASTKGFECGVTDESMWYGDHRCNPDLTEFSEGEAASPTPPAWFEILRNVWNALDYTFTYNVSLTDPDLTECLVYRDKTYDADFQINIVGNPTSQLTPDAGCTQVFEYFNDITGPVVSLVNKRDLILECGSYAPGDITAWLNSYAGIVPAPDITDNCDDGGFLIGNNYSALQGLSCGPDSVTTVIFTVQDSCGNSSNYSAYIRLRDTGKPRFTNSLNNPLTIANVPHVLTLNSCPVNVPVYTIGVDIKGADNCDAAPVITYTSSSTKTTDGTCTDNTYDITRSWKVTDDCNNDSVWTQILHVVDNTPPAWNPVYNLSILVRDTTVNCGAVPVLVDIPNSWYIETCDPSPLEFARDVSTQVMVQSDPGYYNYDISRYWSVQDNCNAALEWPQVITVRDTVAPQITRAASNSSVQCEGIGVTTSFDTWKSTRGGALATDNCTPVNFLIWTDNDVPGWNVICGNSRSKTITYTVTDPSGKSSSTEATFTYTDTQAPTYTGTWSPAGPYGPFDSISVITPAYTDMSQITTAGITVSDGCALTSELNISLHIDTIYLAGCDFNLRRTYTISDDCGNSVVLPAQTFTVRDGVKPVIVKNLSTLSGCALDPVTQTTTIGGLALRAANITDNCSAGSYFITNADTRIQYRTVHGAVSPWTFGNPDELVFQEGVTEVWYQVTDANNNVSLPKRLYDVTVLHMPVITDVTTAEPTGIVGGADNPLRYSTHRYTVTMAQISNLTTPVGNTGFKIYTTGDRATPFAAGTAYTIALSNVGNDVTATITFNGTLPEGGVYDLVFVEQDAGGCDAEEFFTFTLGAPFDVDIDDMASQCPNVDNDILIFGTDVQADGTGTNTTLVYHIRLMSPVNYQNDWHFDYEIITNETGGGTDATIQSVAFTDNGGGANLGTPPTGSSGTVNVDYNSSGYFTNDITMTIVIKDIHATTQEISVNLTGITGSAGEVDLNVILGTVNDLVVGIDASSDQNNVRILINNLPLPQNVVGVE